MRELELTEQMRTEPPEGWRVAPCDDGRTGWYAYRTEDRWPYAHEDTREGVCVAAWTEHHNETPPGWHVRSSEYLVMGSDERHTSWHGHTAAGDAIVSTVSSARDRCLALCWEAFGMTRDAFEAGAEAVVEHGRAVIKLRQAMMTTDSTSLPELVEQVVELSEKRLHAFESVRAAALRGPGASLGDVVDEVAIMLNQATEALRKFRGQR